MGNRTYFVTDRELRLPLVQPQSTPQERRLVDRLIQHQSFIPEFNRFGNLIVKETPNSNTPQFLLEVNHSRYRQELIDIVEKHYRSPA
jgi:hypothetical protein